MPLTDLPIVQKEQLYLRRYLWVIAKRQIKKIAVVADCKKAIAPCGARTSRKKLPRNFKQFKTFRNNTNHCRRIIALFLCRILKKNIINFLLAVVKNEKPPLGF